MLFGFLALVVERYVASEASEANAGMSAVY